MANKFQLKRTSTSGVTPNTTNVANSAYIAPGELAVNMADKKLFTSNTSGGLLELGSNLTNLSVTGTTTLVSISANGSTGTNGQVLATNGTSLYWSSSAGGGASLSAGNGLTSNDTHYSVLANTGIVANATGTYVNSTYIATLSANNATYLNGQLASYYTNASNISTGTLAAARLPALYLGTTQIQSTSAAQAVSGITTLAAGNTTITGFANVSGAIQGGSTLTIAGAASGITTLAAGNTTITGFANVSTTLQVAGVSTFNANVVLNAADHIVLSSTSGISANGTYGTSGQVLTSNGTVVYWASPASGGWVRKTANYTAVSGEAIIADTSGGTFTITLPATPSTGASVKLADGANWYTTNLTVGRNGQTIEGAAENLVVDVAGISLELVFDGTTWEVYAATGPSEIPSQTGNSGKYLYTNGTTVSWANVVGGAVITANNTDSQTYYFPMTNTTSGSWSNGVVSNTKLSFVPSTGTLTVDTLVESSTESIKENIRDTKYGLSDILKLRAVDYNKIEYPDRDEVGLLAEDVANIVPEVISYDVNGNPTGVQYSRLVPILIKAIQQLKKEVNELKDSK